MSVVTSYATGTPCWVDVSTTDLGATQAFYSGLFEWTLTDVSDPGSGRYEVFQRDGASVAGVGEWPEGVPVVWSVYFATEDVDASAATIRGAGGEVLLEPMEVMGAGRMCFARDSTGASFGVWQAGVHIGTSLVDEPGAPTWHELRTGDADAGAAFYSTVFGWEGEPRGDDPTFVYRLMHAGMRSCGIWQTDGLPRWTVYFAVEDADRTTARAEELGGALVGAARDTPYGRVAAIEDPLGASFSVIQVPEESVA